MIAASVSSETTATLTGTSCRLCSRRWAVMVMVSSPASGAVTAGSGAAGETWAAAGAAAAASAVSEIIDRRAVRRIFGSFGRRMMGQPPGHPDAPGLLAMRRHESITETK